MEQPEKIDKYTYPLFGSFYLRKLKQRVGKVIFHHLPITRHVFNHLRWEFNATWVRLNNKCNPLYTYKRSKITKGVNLSVNVACGPNGKIGWVNLDLMNHKNVSLRYDCRRNLPFCEGSVARIRCEQFFEHLDPREEAPFFLESCYKILKEGGILRIVVPDARKFLLAYQSGKKEDWLNLGWDLDNLPDGFHTQMDIINHIFRQDEEHRYAYDFVTLKLFLERAGFKKIYNCEFGMSKDPELCDDLIEHKLHSLYVEAVK